MGSGGLIGKRALLESMPPYHFGGDMIEWVHDDDSTIYTNLKALTDSPAFQARENACKNSKTAAKRTRTHASGTDEHRYLCMVGE